MKEEIILTLLHAQNQIKLVHWQTDLDAKHRTLGDLYSTLESFIDDFVETMMGTYGRPAFPETFGIELMNPKTLDILNYLSEFKLFLFDLTNKLDSIKDTDLLNKRDEILGSVNHTLYLLTLKY